MDWLDQKLAREKMIRDLARRRPKDNPAKVLQELRIPSESWHTLMWIVVDEWTKNANS